MNLPLVPNVFLLGVALYNGRPVHPIKHLRIIFKYDICYSDLDESASSIYFKRKYYIYSMRIIEVNSLLTDYVTVVVNTTVISV